MSKLYRILIPLAASGHDPTEVAVPYQYFVENPKRQCQVTFATADGTTPEADTMMLQGTTGSLLGATAGAKQAYQSMSKDCKSWNKPIAWRGESFDITQFDCVFLPGGHEKGVRSIIEDDILHSHLRQFFPLTDKTRSLQPGEQKKILAAICHGVQVLAFAAASDSPLQEFPLEQFHSSKVPEVDGKRFRSVIHACKTTALPGYMESSIYGMTCAFLGDYYKTFGAGTPNVEDYVAATLDDATQFDSGPRWYQIMQAGQPFVVEDEKMNYLSARYPPDAQKLAERVIEMSMTN